MRSVKVYQSPIAVRAYATKSNEEPNISKRRNNRNIGYSEWVLIFDTETTTDPAQQLRFGCFHVRKNDMLVLKGIFYDPPSLNEDERTLLEQYATVHNLDLLTVGDFIEQVFFYYVYDLNGLCIGLNLPFDISRLAIGHASARGAMRGGFTLRLSDNKQRAWIQIKSVNSKCSLIRFTIPAQQRTSRNRRKHKQETPPHRGYFVDVRTLACALFSGSWSLKTLAQHLKTENQKLKTEEHGEALSSTYLDYALQDVQVTWECFEKLRELYNSYGLNNTPINRVFSEASLGKAFLKEMGLKPWRELQPDFPPELLGSIMSSYYGGRSEIHVRRQIVRVLYCDFLSMYPTVCTLMRLWKFVIAKGLKWRDATAETRTLLDSINLEDLRNADMWNQLTTLVQIKPDADVLPVRAPYNATQYTIGTNYLRSTPLWYTLADCIASKLLTGRSPQIISAIRFQPIGVQKGLKPISIAGNQDYRVDPVTDDFYRSLIDLRSEVKAKLKICLPEEKAQHEIEQLALKICANATSYGIFVELNVSKQDDRIEMICYGSGKSPFKAKVKNIEEPGKYFHPLLATLITGAARLILAITEKLALDSGLDWAFCDTDSMALSKPDSIEETEFQTRARSIVDWFTSLNPYKIKGPLLKIENVNYNLSSKEQEIEPLFCFAVSSKRYVLFNLDKLNRPVIRKASAHGLGHLLSPQVNGQDLSDIPEPAIELSEIGVDLWQYWLWYRIVKAAMDFHPNQVKTDDLPGFDQPAASRYAAMTPALLHWFYKYNQGKLYRNQVMPFNFLLAFQAMPFCLTEASINGVLGDSRVVQNGSKNRLLSHPRPVSTYEKDTIKAAQRCFDRETGKAVPLNQIRTYRSALAQYHLHREPKFDNADETDTGHTERRLILATKIEHIGKEANRWDEQGYLGLDPEAQTVYGMSPDDLSRWIEFVISECRRFSQRALALASDLSLRHVSRVLCGKSTRTLPVMIKLWTGIRILKEQ